MNTQKIRAGLSQCVAPDRIRTEPEALSEFGPHALARVLPKSAEEVQAIVRWARQSQAGLVPSSSGPPHIHGLARPMAPAVVVDLSAMDRILRIDRKNRVVMIEPGVRFGALAPALAREGLRLPMPIHPRAGKSALAAYLEREPTALPKYQWDYMDPLCCLEVVFGDGHLFRTGTAAGPGTLEQQWASGDAQVNNMGPTQADFGRLFQGAQGTMGIVTWGTVRLEVLPRRQEMFFVAGQKLSGLWAVQHWLQRLRLADELFVANGAFFSNLMEIPSASQRSVPPWVLAFSLSGSGPLAMKQYAYREKDMAATLAKNGAGLLTSVAGITGASVLSKISQASPDPYWKLRPRGGVHEVFFLTTFDKAQSFVEAAWAESAKVGVAPDNTGVYVQPLLGGRSCHVEFDFYFDPADAGQAAKIARLGEILPRSLIARKAFFSRPYREAAKAVWEKDAVSFGALKKIKAIFDPAGILSPGALGL